MPVPTPSSPVKSALRTLDILELLSEQPRPMTAQEIAVTLGIPVSSLSYLLSTLVDRAYLERDRRHYSLGPAIDRFRRSDGEPGLADRVAPVLRAITRELNETAAFFVLREFEIEAVACEIGEQSLRYTFEVGQRAPLHAFAAGKALLATMSPDQLDLYFATVERRAFTPRTLHEEGALRETIEGVRREGIARTREEHTPGIAGIGRAAIVDGKALGAFSIAMPLARFDRSMEQRAIRLLSRAVDILQGDRGRAPITRAEASGGAPR